MTPNPDPQPTNEETFPDCKHCGHAGLEHNEEFGNCNHKYAPENGYADVCECPGYEDPSDYEERMDRQRQMVYEMNAAIDRRMR